MLITMQAAADTTQLSAIQSDSLHDLFAQAGGFEWPILGVLLAGLLTLALAAVRLLADHYAARKMRALRVGAAHATELEAAALASDDSLYRRLLEAMLQVWRSTPQALGNESGTVLAAARAALGRTQRLVGFYSSTAGGLGLLGTLVGIYALFSAQTRDAQTIFAGIAIAIVSTLLGIVVSIILELLEALLHHWASRYMERAEEWAAAVRYRLLSLTGQDSDAP